MEGDAGTRQLNPTDAEDAPNDSVAVSEQEPTGKEHQDSPAAEETTQTPSRRRVSRNSGWSLRVSTAVRLGSAVAGWPGSARRLAALTIAAVVGGILLIRDNRGIEEVNRNDAAALQAAKDCVAAMQAPDTAAMSAAQMKIMECSTGAFGAQASTFGGILVEAYQAANVQVAVSDMRAAVERHDPDGSVQVLVAVRIKVTNSDVADQESGYRLRVTMTPDEGTVPDRQDGTGHVVTAVLDASTDAKAAGPPSAQPLASWPARAGALCLDVLLGVGVLAVLAPLVVSAPRRDWLWWVYTVSAAVIVLLILANRWLLPTVTGWSLGRAVCGIRVVRRDDGAAVGFVRLMMRDFAHLLDTAALFIGWLWPLWDSRNRTFADLLLRTEVHRVDRPARDMRRFAAKVLAAAVVVSAAFVALNYFVVYRNERAVDQARAEIAEQGPRIVEQLLTYNVDTLKDDFNRAQSLATDSYRSQLVAQQEAVQKAGPTSNEYWAVSSAVLSAEADRAAMLLAMQGQRGTNPQDLRFITATVRVDFDKSRDGKWRVASLSVLKKPLMEAAPQ